MGKKRHWPSIFIKIQTTQFGHLHCDTFEFGVHVSW